VKVERQERLGFGLGPELAHPIAQDGDAAAIAEHAEALEDLRRPELGRVLEQRLDRGVVRVE